MGESVAVVSLLINVLLVAATVFTMRVAWKHFTSRAVLDWLTQFNTYEFFKSDERVCSLVDDEDSTTPLVDRINERPENITAVTHVLSYALQAATATKYKLMNKKFLMRFSVFIVPFYWDTLRPWIEHRRKFRKEPYLYADLEWLAEEIKTHKEEIFADLKENSIRSS